MHMHYFYHSLAVRSQEASQSLCSREIRIPSHKHHLSMHWLLSGPFSGTESRKNIQDTKSGDFVQQHRRLV